MSFAANFASEDEKRASAQPPITHSGTADIRPLGLQESTEEIHGKILHNSKCVFMLGL